MKKRNIRGWKKKILSLVLALAMMTEPSIVSLAAGGQTVSEKTVTEESTYAEESATTEISEEEESETTEEPETTEEVETSETEEESSEEETEEPKLAEEDFIAGDLVYATSTEADFEVTDGVLTKYTGTATEVKIPDGVTKIAAYVFQNNTTIESVTCPDSLRIIGEYAFSGCTGLRKVTLNEGLTTIEQFAFQSVGFGGKTETQATVYGTLVIPSTVSEIGPRAFMGSAYLGEVIFKNGDTQSINYPPGPTYHNMFEGCTSLKKVTLPDRATKIPYGAFMKCTALEEVSLGANVETIDQYAFQYCSALKEITCPSSLKSIEKYAFSGCKGLREVTLNEGLTSIGEYAFAEAGFGGKTETQATVYGTLVIPSTVSQIGPRAFMGSAYLGEVIFKNGDTQSINYPPGPTYHNMFEGCTSLKKVTLPDRATKIPYGAFMKCTALEEVSLGANVETIDQYAFQYCSALKEITCPSSLKSIGKEAFSGCTGLMEVQLNEGLETIGERAFEGAGFGGKTETQATVYGTLTIPSTVYSIGNYAFFRCAYLEEVTFLNGRIEALALAPESGNACTFENCKNLKRVYLPERLKVLPAYVFQGCTALNTLYIPKNVEQINDRAVENCNYKTLVIYGDTGSAAESFANKKGIQFKNKSELGLYVTSLKLNRIEISFAGEEAIGRQVTLKTTVLPSTAQNKAVVYTSNDEEVATVDDNGIVTIVGYGETDIVVSALENEDITATCHVKILKKWTDEELNTIRQYIEENNNLTVLSNVYTNLQDLTITAPDEIDAKWKTSYEVDTGVHKYDVLLNKAGYQSTILKDVAVTGITVTGIELDASSIVQLGKDYKAKVKVLLSDGELDDEDYQIEWRSTNSDYVKVTASLENPLEATVTGSKAGKSANVVVKVVLNKGGQAVSVAKADLGKTWFESTLQVKVSDYSIVDEITVTAKQNQNPVGLEELSELVNLTDKVSYELFASASGCGEPISNAAFTWKSSNTDVAKITTDRSGKVTLTVNGKGTSVITVTASKNGGYSTSFKVTVKDSMPRLVEKSVKINSYLENPEEMITLIPSDGYEISDESLSVVDAKSGNATAFEIKHVEGNTYSLGIKEGESVDKKTYTVKILAKTTANEDTSHELPLKISVVKEAPKVSIQQSAINLYEKDGRGVVRIVTDAEINSISYTSNAGIGNVRLVAAETDTEEGILYVKSENAKANDYTKAANKGTITITFDGYKEEASYKKSITLSVNKKLPTITATPGSATLYPETLADTTQIVLRNKNANEDVLEENGYLVSVNKLSNYQYRNDDGEQFPEIQAKKGAKAGTLTYTVENSNWIDGVKVTAKRTIKIGKEPTLSFATGKLVLNTAYTTGNYDAVSVDAYVKGFENIDFDNSKTKIVGKDAGSVAALKDGALELYMEDGAIKAGITDSGYFKKAGNYTYMVTAYSQQDMPVTGTLKVSVALAKNTPSVSFKTTGSIDLLNRENTSVIITPTVKNYTGTVKKVELYGVNAGKFDAKTENGKIVIQAKSDKSLKMNSAYQLGVYVTLDSGVSLKGQIKITPKQKTPKLLQSKKSIVLFESAKGIAYGEEIAINVAAGQTGQIKDIKLATASDTFGYEDGLNGTGIIYVKDMASLKPGKSYTLKFAVTFEKEASNAKPVYISLKVNYNK